MTGSTCTSNTPGINPNTPGINPRFLSSQLYNLKALENNHHPYFHWGDSNSNCHHRSVAPGAFIFCNIITGLKKNTTVRYQVLWLHFMSQLWHCSKCKTSWKDSEKSGFEWKWDQRATQFMSQFAISQGEFGITELDLLTLHTRR